MARVIFAIINMLMAMLLPADADAMTTDDVIDRWAEAIGGRENIMKAELTHSTSKVTIFGLEGTLHEWGCRGRPSPSGT